MYKINKEAADRKCFEKKKEKNPVFHSRIFKFFKSF